MYHKAYGIIETLAPLYVGATAGEETGNLNLIFRDQFTQTGIIPGSSLRGRFRADMRHKEPGTENIWYGHQAEGGIDGSTTEAFVKFEYASLVWLPVFCPGQPIVWVTSPQLLKRYQQITGKPANSSKVPAVNSAKLKNHRKFLFFNLGFLDQLNPNPTLSDWVPGGIGLDNLVVVNDNEIGIIHEMALYRQTRTKLENDVKKVEHFFGVEALPEGCILVFPIAIKTKGWCPFPKGSSQDLYFGGLESIGFGRCQVSIASGEYKIMAWTPYGLDEEARKLVQSAKKGDEGILEGSKQGFKEAYKMREAVAFGLERFWGEAKRHEADNPAKAKYWKEVWDTLAKILKKTDVNLPNHDNVNIMDGELWKLKPEEQQIALAVLTQFCDCLVWWTQRYKGE